MGGVAYLSDSEMSDFDSTFNSNVAGTFGGSIESAEASILKLENSHFVGGQQQNATYGGAIDIDSTAGETVLDSVQVFGCTAQFMGGGIYCDSDNALLTNCTIRSNHAPTGGGLGAWNPAAELQGNTICDNTNDQVSAGFRDRGGNEISEDCCPGDFDGNGVVDGQDLALLLAEWNDCAGDCVADLNGDGAVDGADMALLLARWGGCN